MDGADAPSVVKFSASTGFVHGCPAQGKHRNTQSGKTRLNGPTARVIVVYILTTDGKNNPVANIDATSLISKVLTFQIGSC